MSRARYAFRSEGGELRAFGETHEVRVRRDSIAFVPVASSSRRGRPLHLRTRSVSRERSLIEDHSRAFEVDAEGGLRVAHGPAIETLVNASTGAEQAWSFRARPTGAGDLVVLVEASGYELAAETETGLHFRDAESNLYARYGRATWIDRDRKTAVRASFRRGLIELRVPAEIVDSSAYPAVLDPVLSAETSIDQPIQWPASYASEPKVAHGAGVFMAVWRDAVFVDGLSAARVRESDGAILDPSGIPLTRAPGEWRAVEYDGVGNFVVVHATEGSGIPSLVYAQRVRASDGVVLDPTPVVVSDSQPGVIRRQPAIARGPNGLFVVWHESTASGEIRGRRINFDLTPIDPAVVSFGDGRDMDVDYADGHYLVVWERTGQSGDTDLQARRVRESDGAVLDPAGLIPQTPGLSERNPAIADDGTRFLLVWMDLRSNRGDIRGRRMVAATGVFDTPDTLLRIGDQNLFDQFEGLDHDSSGYLLTWDQIAFNTITVYGRRVTDDVVPLDGPLDTGGILLGAASPGEARSQVAAGGAGFFVAWQQVGSGMVGNQAAGRRVDTAVSILDPTPLILSTQSTRQIDPEVAYADGIYLVAWYDRRVPAFRDRYDVYAARIRESDGAVLDPIAIEIAQDVIASSVNQNVAYAIGKPSVASDGTDFLLAWPSQAGLQGTRIVGATGALLDQPPIQISPPNESGVHPASGFAMGNYLVAWSNYQLLRAARIDAATGAVLDVPPLEPGSQNFETFTYQTAPSIACTASNCLVAFRGYVFLDSRELFATRIDMTTGADLDIPTSIPPITDLGGVGEVATDGTNYLIMWLVGTPNSFNIVGRRMRASDGAYVDSSTITLHTVSRFFNGPRLPAASFDGRHFVLAWADYRNIAANGEFAEVMGTRVDPSGSVLDPNGFVISSTTTPLVLSIDPNPAIASSGRATSLIVYPRFDLAPPYRNFRIKARFFDNRGELGETCTSTVICGSGNCTGGICCDAACGGDCQSCAGGTCQNLSGNLCRAAAAACDAPELCDGVTGVCPADSAAVAGTPCRTSTAACDPVEVCDGVGLDCPADVIGCSDAGLPDAEADAGDEPDGAAAPDAALGVPDASTTFDAKPSDTGGGEEEDQGCGCASARPVGRGFPQLLLLAILLCISTGSRARSRAPALTTDKQIGRCGTRRREGCRREASGHTSRS